MSDHPTNIRARVFDQCDDCGTIAMCYLVGDDTLLCPDCYADMMGNDDMYYDYDDKQDV